MKACERCSGKALAESLPGCVPGYMESKVVYGKLTLTDDRGVEWTVQPDETAAAAIERLEGERERRYAEADLRIDRMIAGVRAWEAGKPYDERPDGATQYVNGVLVDLAAEQAVNQWSLTKAQQCAEFLRHLLADWQKSQDIKKKAAAVGFKANAVERARELLNVQREYREGSSYWRLPPNSDLRTSDKPASEIGNQKSAEGDHPAAHQEAA